MPVVETEATQLGPGEPVWRMMTVIGRDSLVHRLKLKPLTLHHVVPEPDWIVLVLIMRWQGDCIFNGRLVDRYELLLSTSPDGYTANATDRDGIVVGLRRARLVSACAALAGLSDEDVHVRDLALDLGRTRFTRLCVDLWETMRAGWEEISPSHFALEGAVESDLFSNVARVLVPHLTVEFGPSSSTLAALRVVRAAQNAFTDPAHPPSVADLCRAAGVREAWLHRCFAEVCGTSPARYIRMRRLSQARDILLDPDDPPQLVKQAALATGFTQPGRFAQYYEETFRESPSQTLRRARHMDGA